MQSQPTLNVHSTGTSDDRPERPTRHWRRDLTSGFLVFLIALPLSLGIAMASGYPPMAGLLTAICGGLIAPWFTNSQLTIKGPAAGLIVIVLGAVQDLGHGDIRLGYIRALGVSVVAGSLQMVFGILRLGAVAEVFPAAAVHGMLAAVGVIVAAKQVHILLGVSPHAKEPLALIAEVPNSFKNANPEIALMGVVCMAILFVWPLIQRPSSLRRVPAPIVALLVGVVMGSYFGIAEHQSYLWAGHKYPLGDQFLVHVSNNILTAITFPDFSAVWTTTGLKYVVMLALVGTIESLLSAKAIDVLDPRHRRSNLNQDLVAIGVANMAAAMLGGLPMISEIVRSSANISNGARTKMSNFYHGVLILIVVALFPSALHHVPLAALAAMLVVVGYRLASPHNFVHTFRVGVDEFAVFLTTLLVTLATDLLVGVTSGLTLMLLIHGARGLPARAVFRATAKIQPVEDGYARVSILDALVFSNWISLRTQLDRLGNYHVVELNLEHTTIVDHTAIAKLEELGRELRRSHKELRVTGLDAHRQLTAHAQSCRVRARVR
jgi:MFS superfamily sulfate permease-like transporter